MAIADDREAIQPIERRDHRLILRRFGSLCG